MSIIIALLVIVGFKECHGLHEIHTFFFSLSSSLNMTRLLFILFPPPPTSFDSKGLQPVNGVGVHSAFEDDAIDEDDLAKYARDSVETRVLCFFEENNKANVV